MAQLIDLEPLFADGYHNAFTDLLRFRDRWWCTFREAESHGDSIGTLRVLVSEDGDTWSSAAEIAEHGYAVERQGGGLAVALPVRGLFTYAINATPSRVSLLFSPHPPLDYTTLFLRVRCGASV